MVIFSKECNAYIASIRLMKDSLHVEVTKSREFAMVCTESVTAFFVDLLNGLHMDCVAYYE